MPASTREIGTRNGKRPNLRASLFGPPAIDCDVHIAVPSVRTILPYLDDYWQQQFLSRGIDRISWNMTSEPAYAPINARPDWRPTDGGKPGTDLALLQTEALDVFGSAAAIANCIWGGQVLPSEDMSAVVCRAVNDWIAAEWLDREPRLRASIVVPLNAPELAGEEIERRAADRRFVQVLLLAAQELPLGRRQNWPIYAAAERHGIAIGVHAGSTYHHPPIAGWASTYLEDYVANAFAFESALLSLVSEGVFAKFPALQVVFSESGVTWLPAALWRFNKTWRGVRSEIPWVKQAPSEIVRENVRLTLQPFDAPADEGGARCVLERLVEQLDSERTLLFSTDFPHWHFEGRDALPVVADSPLGQRILYENAMETYSRLADSLTA